MKKNVKRHQNLVIEKLGKIRAISLTHQGLVLARLEKTKENPERLLNWNAVSNYLTRGEKRKGFDAKKFNGKLKVNEEALIIQKHLRDEWN